MSKEGTTLIFIFVEFDGEDQSKYLACFGDMRMRSVAGVGQTQKKYRSFYEKCSKRTLADDFYSIQLFSILRSLPKMPTPSKEGNPIDANGQKHNRSTIKRSVDNKQSSNGTNNKKQRVMEEDNSDADNIKFEKIEKKIAKCTEQISNLSNRVERNEIEMKRKTIRIFGFPITETEPIKSFQEFLNLITLVEFDMTLVTNCFFMPRQVHQAKKSLKVEFLTFDAKILVMSNCKNLNGKKFRDEFPLSVDNDLTMKQIKSKEIAKAVKEAFEYAATLNTELLTTGSKIKLIGFDRLKEHKEGDDKNKSTPSAYPQWLKKIQKAKNKDDKLNGLLASIQKKEKELRDMI